MLWLPLCTPGEGPAHACMQMEGLKRDMLAKIAETKAACEASIEAKAIELAEGLEAADRCPCAPAAPPAWYGTFKRQVRGMLCNGEA